VCKSGLGGSMIYWIYPGQLELTCQTYDLWTPVDSIIFFYLYIKKYKDQFKINQILNDKIKEEKLTKS
jgi:hypothetical protein